MEKLAKRGRTVKLRVGNAEDTAIRVRANQVFNEETIENFKNTKAIGLYILGVENYGAEGAH